jgi:stress-induced morphogen
MVDPREVERCLEAAFPGARIVVANPAGDGEHLEVQVVSEAFKGRGLVDQHRMVYAALGELMPRIHALQLRTEPRGEDVR